MRFSFRSVQGSVNVILTSVYKLNVELLLKTPVFLYRKIVLVFFFISKTVTFIKASHALDLTHSVNGSSYQKKSYSFKFV